MENITSTEKVEYSAGQIPRITVVGETIPEVYEKSLLVVWNMGHEAKTQYDKPGDPPSKDCTMIMVIKNPLAEPRIYKSFIGGPLELESYRLEVVFGIHDEWIEPDSTKWPYTYHDRLFNYNPRYPEKGDGINQIELMINALAENPHSRRVEAITWYPWFDPYRHDPPCLQRVWGRLIPNENGLVLNMNTNWRSRDAYKAAYMNLYALSDLQRYIARRISEKHGKEVLVGPMMDYSDSYHIYGNDFINPELPMSFQGYLESLKKRTWEQRVAKSESWYDLFIEARHIIAARLEAMRQNYGMELPKEKLNEFFDVDNFTYPKEWDE